MREKVSARHGEGGRQARGTLGLTVDALEWSLSWQSRVEARRTRATLLPLRRRPSRRLSLSTRTLQSSPWETTSDRCAHSAPSPPPAQSSPTPLPPTGPPPAPAARPRRLALPLGRPRPAQRPRARLQGHHPHPPRDRAPPARARRRNLLPRRRPHVRLPLSPSLSRERTSIADLRSPTHRRFVQESRNNVENTLRAQAKDAQDDIAVLDKKAKVRPRRAQRESCLHEHELTILFTSASRRSTSRTRS